MEQLGSHWTDFHKIWYWVFLEKTAEQIQVLLILDKENGYITWRPLDIFDHISLISS